MLSPRVPFVACLLLSSAAAQTELFFTEYQFNNPKIKSIELDGSGVQELFTIPAADWLPVGIAFDSTSGLVYWSDGVSPNTNVFVANLDGTGIQDLVSPGGGTRGPVLDGLGKLYYTAGNQLRRANLDGTGEETLFTAAESSPLRAPAVDGTNGHLYVSADGEILRMDLDGSDRKTIVAGLSTAGPVVLDAASRLLYWIDSDTISDYVGRARLDGSEFTVLIDNSPGVVQSSGLIALLLDRQSQELYVADDLRDDIRRADADGSNLMPFYASPAGLSPSGLTLSSGDPPQALLDCNGNGQADSIDIASGSSSDCNDNGVPDECEAGMPCAPAAPLLDQGSDPVSASRTVGGPSSSPGSQFEVFQPFDVPAGGWSIGGLELDGWTANYASGAGFSATVLPDDGTGSFPDEGTPLASLALNFRFDPDRTVWVGSDLQLQLAPGRYWVRLTSADAPTYHGAVNQGTGGLGSVSRSGLGNLFNAGPIALRLVESGCMVSSYCIAAPNSFSAGAVMGNAGSGSLAANDLILTVAGAIPNQSGLFFYGPAVQQGVFGDGFLCVSGGFFRLGPPLGIDGLGNAARAVDYLQPPLDAGPGMAVVGGTLHVQFWYRDPAAGGSGFNLSNGLSVVLCP